MEIPALRIEQVEREPRVAREQSLKAEVGLEGFRVLECVGPEGVGGYTAGARIGTGRWVVQSVDSPRTVVGWRRRRVRITIDDGPVADHLLQRSLGLEYVAGYALHNDYSERAWQLDRGGQWVKGKSFDTYAPIGPFLATRSEIPDPHSLGLWLEVNGERLQESNTSDMIFRVPAVVSYLSQFMTLLPGDIISTGTPSGVGLGLDPPRYLKPGDVVELGIDGLGTSRQQAVDFETLRDGNA